MFEKLKSLFNGKELPVGAVSRRDKAWKYCSSYCVQPRTGIVRDEDFYHFVKKHTHWWDRLDLHFISDCVLESTDILYGYVEEPKGKWFFDRRQPFYGRWIEDDEWKQSHEYPHADFIKDGGKL